MVTRYLPASFPLVRRGEVSAGNLITSSLMRRIVQSQNWLWANMRRVWAMHGSEGNGYAMSNILAAAGGPERPSLEPLPDGLYGRPISAFFVPRNWCGGSRVKLQGSATFTRADGATTCRVYALLQNLDETFTGHYESVALSTGTNDWTLTIRVPQDGEYQIKVFVQMTDAAAGGDYFENYVTFANISARYIEPDAEDLGTSTGVANITNAWAPTHDLNAGVFWPVASALLKRVVDNTMWQWSYRGPEICQTWLKEPYANSGSTWVEVGRYTVALPLGVNEWEGRLFVRVEGAGGAGCEVRLKVQGSVIQTWTAIAAGDSTLTITPFNPATGVAPYSERLVTIEARHADTVTNWGTIVWGVSLWESGIDLGGVTFDTGIDFQPSDEDMFEGDDSIELSQSGTGLNAGYLRMLLNDRWLFYHRRRTLISDWRHRTLKRLGVFTSTTVTDPRVDWTKADEDSEYQTFVSRNITIRGDDTADNDVDAIGDFPDGIGTPASYSETPYTYPTDATFARHGRRIGYYMMGHEVLGLPSAPDACLAVRIRGRRLRPVLMSTDQNGFGPIPEEPPYENRAYFQIVQDGSVGVNLGGGQRVDIVGTPQRRDWEIKWHPAFVTLHAKDTGVVVTEIRGRLPPVASGAPPEVRPEGMLFEVEVNSVWIADEPLNQAQLDELP